eukprot:TRINITY_DN7253_c0_g1_i1.p1 TRINITY_DN7253_c0_g1~~TRINITY_DN7253_c0_g1_i1.p1  ORF type:complete len:447 (+),score=121.85 TRINITY_DN7253_c0_g1_i1:81-1343(+)
MAALGSVAAAAASSDASTGLKSQADNGWVVIQRSTFTNWLNTKIKGKIAEVDEEKLAQACQDGVCLLVMLEEVSGKKVGRYTKNPKMKIHKIENLNVAFEFMKKENLKLVNIGSSDIEAGNEKLILGLLWTIIYHYQIAPTLATASSGHGKKGGFREQLLQWVNTQIPEYGIKNFNKDWLDGRAMCALVNAVAGAPEVLPNHQQMMPGSARKNAQAALDAAEEHLGIPKVLEAEDMTNPALDELSVITYISYFKTAKRVVKDDKAAAPAAAAPEPVQEPEPEPEPEPAAAADAGNGKSKNGDLPPPWERAEDWRVYEGVNLGGRCKIRVYFSLTTSSATYRKHKEEMMRLFERMEVHKRPDFEPWIPVDMDMEKSQRDAIFEKAGTRQLPMLFVDDEYIGGYDKVMDLNESNELIKILEY